MALLKGCAAQPFGFAHGFLDGAGRGIYPAILYQETCPDPEGAGCEVKIALSGSGFNQSRNMLSVGLTEHMFLGGRHLKDETT
jgi:hypothetical protein